MGGHLGLAVVRRDVTISLVIRPYKSTVSAIAATCRLHLSILALKACRHLTLDGLSGSRMIHLQWVWKIQHQPPAQSAHATQLSRPLAGKAMHVGTEKTATNAPLFEQSQPETPG